MLIPILVSVYFEELKCKGYKHITILTLGILHIFSHSTIPQHLSVTILCWSKVLLRLVILLFLSFPPVNLKKYMNILYNYWDDEKVVISNMLLNFLIAAYKVLGGIPTWGKGNSLMKRVTVLRPELPFLNTLPLDLELRGQFWNTQQTSIHFCFSLFNHSVFFYLVFCSLI